MPKDITNHTKLCMLKYVTQKVIIQKNKTTQNTSVLFYVTFTSDLTKLMRI